MLQRSGKLVESLRSSFRLLDRLDMTVKRVIASFYDPMQFPHSLVWRAAKGPGSCRLGGGAGFAIVINVLSEKG